MTSAGSGTGQGWLEPARSFGWLSGPDGVEGFIVEVLHVENLTIPAKKALIFIEREHHDASHAVPLDANRMKHGFVGVESKLARNLFRRDRNERFRHHIVSSTSFHPLDSVPLAHEAG